MSRRPVRQGSNDGISLDAEKTDGLPDRLAAIQMDLRRLCEDNTLGMPDDAKRAIWNACERLHLAIVDVVDIVERIDGPHQPYDGVADGIDSGAEH